MRNSRVLEYMRDPFENFHIISICTWFKTFLYESLEFGFEYIYLKFWRSKNTYQFEGPIRASNACSILHIPWDLSILLSIFNYPPAIESKRPLHFENIGTCLKNWLSSCRILGHDHISRRTKKSHSKYKDPHWLFYTLDLRPNAPAIDATQCRIGPSFKSSYFLNIVFVPS